KLIQIEIDPLVAIVDAAHKTSPIDSLVSIDASSSFDPNSPSGAVIHAWSCLNLSGPTNRSCDLPSSLDLSSPILSIAANTLQANTRMLFTDSIRSLNISTLTSTVTTLLDTVPARSPTIRFDSLEKEKFNTDEFVRIRAFVSSAGGDLSSIWQISLDDGEHFISLTSFSTLQHTNSSKETSASESVVLSLTIPPGGQSTPSWPGLLPGRLYSVSLVALNEEGESAGFINLQMNSPPTVGRIEIDTSPLIALSPFTVSLGDGWSDTDLPLSVTFGIRSIMIDGFSSLVSLPSSLSSSTSLVLPSASKKGGSCGDRNGHAITVKVCDRLFACSSTESSLLSVARPSNLSASLAAIAQEIHNEIDNGNSWVALPLLGAMWAENCTQSMESISADKIVTRLLTSIDETSSPSEYREVMSVVTRMIPSLSPTTQLKAFSFVTQYQKLLGIATTSSSRSKRSTPLAASNDVLDTLLPYFDGLLRSNISSTPVSSTFADSYFSTIEVLLSG
ncbi:hypothetical protein PMAYCL1PPCAC_03102, partial [Pristionchus mayeri]